MGVWRHYCTDYDQLPLEDFFLLFGGSLDPKNRRVQLSRIMPWEKEEEDDHDDSDKPSGGKKSLQGRKNPNTSKKNCRKKNHGKLIMDATVAPADVKFSRTLIF